MAAKGGTKVIDRGYNKLREQIAQMAESPEGAHVKVGFIEGKLGDQSHGEGLTVTNVAVFNEFGTPTIPERPFLRDTSDLIKTDIEALSDKMLDQIVRGKSTVKKALDVIGLRVQAAFRRAVNQWDSPPNAPATIRKKGADNPLVDTGQMRNSIEFEPHFKSNVSVRVEVESD
jgi:hypothetical protein